MSNTSLPERIVFLLNKSVASDISLHKRSISDAKIGKYGQKLKGNATFFSLKEKDFSGRKHENPLLMARTTLSLCKKVKLQNKDKC